MKDAVIHVISMVVVLKNIEDVLANFVDILFGKSGMSLLENGNNRIYV